MLVPESVIYACAKFDDNLGYHININPRYKNSKQVDNWNKYYYDSFTVSMNDISTNVLVYIWKVFGLKKKIALLKILKTMNTKKI